MAINAINTNNSANVNIAILLQKLSQKLTTYPSCSYVILKLFQCFQVFHHVPQKALCCILKHGQKLERNEIHSLFSLILIETYIWLFGITIMNLRVTLDSWVYLICKNNIPLLILTALNPFHNDPSYSNSIHDLALFAL